MKPETANRILVLLRGDMEAKLEELMDALRSDEKQAVVDDRIREYKKAYRVLTDFEEWTDKQKGEDES